MSYRRIGLIGIGMVMAGVYLKSGIPATLAIGGLLVIGYSAIKFILEEGQY